MQAQIATLYIVTNLISEYFPWLIHNQLADVCKLSSHPNANVTAKKKESSKLTSASKQHPAT